jgi:hypothetical protein
MVNLCSPFVLSGVAESLPKWAEGRAIFGVQSEMRSNIQRKFLGLNVRRDGSQPGILVRSFSQITTHRVTCSQNWRSRVHGVGTDDAVFHQGGAEEGGQGTDLVLFVFHRALGQYRPRRYLIEGEQMDQRLMWCPMAWRAVQRFPIEGWGGLLRASPLPLPAARVRPHSDAELPHGKTPGPRRT